MRIEHEFDSQIARLTDLGGRLVLVVAAATVHPPCTAKF